MAARAAEPVYATAIAAPIDDPATAMAAPIRAWPEYGLPAEAVAANTALGSTATKVATPAAISRTALTALNARRARRGSLRRSHNAPADAAASTGSPISQLSIGPPRSWAKPPAGHAGSDSGPPRPSRP